jgi:RNA polymerase sigma-70 factor (ECF subfamily)
MRENPDRVEAIRRRDAQVLEDVVRESIPGLFRSARAAGLAPDRAEDAVQGALLVFMKRASDYDGRARVSTWIHGILVRKIWEARKAIRREDGEDAIDQVVESRFEASGRWGRPPQGPLEELARGEFRDELDSCLGDISDRQRMAFTLREVEGFETAEICNILDVTANNLGVLLFRARNGLRECLEAKGFEGSSDAAL